MIKMLKERLTKGTDLAGLILTPGAESKFREEKPRIIFYTDGSINVRSGIVHAKMYGDKEVTATFRKPPFKVIHLDCYSNHHQVL